MNSCTGEKGGAVAVRPTNPEDMGAIETALVTGDLSKLTAGQRVAHYKQTCAKLGLNPFTQPFCYVVLNNKLTLYAKRDAADQLRKIHGITVAVTGQEERDGVLYVYVRATTPDGRADEDVGAVPIAVPKVVKGEDGKPVTVLEPVRGEARANLQMKATTKAKRRVTLSICGLGFLDETEVESVPGHRKAPGVQAEVVRVLHAPEGLEPADVEAPQPQDATTSIAEGQYQRLVLAATRAGCDLEAVRGALGLPDLRAMTVAQFKTVCRTITDSRTNS